MGHRSLPQSRREPLQMTHKPLEEALAVTVGRVSCCMPVVFKTSCSHVFEKGLMERDSENVKLLQNRIEQRLFYIVLCEIVDL